MAYFKLRCREQGGRITTMFIKSSGEFRHTKVGQTLTGTKVNRDGDEPDDALHIIMAAPEDVLSLKPYEMDLLYGTLVPLGTAKISVRSR
jgi:hypothetical protein